LQALHERHARAREHSELLAGIIASVTANFSMASPKKALRPSDFGLGPKPKTSRPSAPALTDAERLAGKPQQATAIEEETDGQDADVL
jgi:hypothetical protein